MLGHLGSPQFVKGVAITITIIIIVTTTIITFIIIIMTITITSTIIIITIIMMITIQGDIQETSPKGCNGLRERCHKKEQRC